MVIETFTGVRVTGRSSFGVRRLFSALLAGGLLTTSLQFAGVNVAAAQVPCVASKGSVAAALAAAKSCAGQVEALDRRTPTSRTVIAKDGTASVEHHVSPRWVRRPNGAWADLDTTLRFDGGTLTATATLLPVTFSPGGTGPLATLTDGGRKLAMTWTDRSLPNPTLAGDTATYAEVLPGVDLRLTALPEGFSEVLVVKSAQAAANPALAQLTFDLQTTGVTLGTAADGGVHAKDASGAVVFSSPRATMWDTPVEPGQSERAQVRSVQAPSAGRAAPKVKAMGEALSGNRLKITPDRSFLTDPAARYPMYIDPTFTGGKASNAWAVVASRSDLANSAFWKSTFMSNSATYGDAGSGLTCDNYSGNTCTSTTYAVRSFFRMETYGAAGASVISSNFEITQKWSWTCNTASDAKLWVTGGFTTTTTWNNQPAWYGDHTVTTPGNRAVGSPAGCQPAGTASFDTTAMVQWGFAQGWTDLSLGLRAVSEGSNLQWKRFDQGSAVLHIRYDHAPSTPDLSDLKVGPTGMTSCGTSAATATRVNTTNGLVVNGVLNDIDGALGDLVRAEWAVNGIAAQYVPAAETAGLTSGSNHSATIPAAAFSNGAAFSWQVRGKDTDNDMVGGWSPWCYLLVDNTAPNPPGIASTDLNLRVGLGIVPGPAATAVVGRSATVTFTPAAADAGAVVGYRYGVAADSDATPSIWLPAGLAGTAVAAVVPKVATFYNSVVVTAVKADGTAGATTSARFRANAATGSTTPVAGDATGDRRADLTALADVGGGKSALWRWDSMPAGAKLNPALAPQGNAGIFPTATSLSTGGDFDGDGLSDVAVLAQSGADVTLTGQLSDGNQLLTQPVARTEAGWVISKMKVVSGDFNGDGRADVAQFYDYGSSQTKLWVHWSQTNSTFSGPNLQWDSGQWVWIWGDSKFVAGDFTGDGKTDIAAVYAPNHTFDGRIATATFTARTDGTGLNGPVTQWDSGGNAFHWANVTPYTGDYTGDGKADLALLYQTGGGPYQSQVWISASAGATLAGPAEAANGGIGPVGAGSVALDTTVAAGQQRYTLVNVGGLTCAAVGSDSRLRGQPCTTDTKQYFTVERRGAAYVSIHPVDQPTWCLDVTGASQADGTAVGQTTCHGVATQPYMLAQYWNVEYVAGVPTASAVKLVTPLSGKCLDLADGLSTPGTPIQQWTCVSVPAQQWFLKPVA